MLLYVLNILYLFLWAILLIHCLRSRQLYPIFGNGWRTKAFWLFTFVFFNPLLSLLYVFCLFCPFFVERLWLRSSLRIKSSVKRNEPRNGSAELVKARTTRNELSRFVIPAFVFTCTFIIIILFNVPRTSVDLSRASVRLSSPNSRSNDKQPFLILNKTGGISYVGNTILKSGVNIGLIDAKNKIQTVSSDSATDQTKVSLHNIMITCKNDNLPQSGTEGDGLSKADRFLELVAIKMLRSLAKLPYVNTAAYYSYGHLPRSGTEGASREPLGRTNGQSMAGKPEPQFAQSDVLITLEIPELIEDKFLLSRQMQVKINCVVSSSASETLSDSSNNISSEAIVPFTIKSELQHSSITLCIECPGTEYEQEVKNISSELTEAIRKQFENLLNKYENLSKTQYASEL